MSAIGCEVNGTVDLATTHSTVAKNITVKSVVTTETQPIVEMENTHKIAALMNEFGPTYQQINESSNRRTKEICEEVTAAIAKIVADTQAEQETLLVDGKTRSIAIEEEYKLKLQNFVEELDQMKAQNLDILEKDLNRRQEMILEQARKRIDDLNEEANRLKMILLHKAQAQANATVDEITQQIAALGVVDVNRLLMSISTTIIQTEANTFDENSVDERKSFHVAEVPMTQTSSKSQTTSSSISKGQ